MMMVMIQDDDDDGHELMVDDDDESHDLISESGVLMYKSVSDRLVTRGQPGETNFVGRTTFPCSNFDHLPLF